MGIAAAMGSELPKFPAFPGAFAKLSKPVTALSLGGIFRKNEPIGPIFCLFFCSWQVKRFGLRRTRFCVRLLMKGGKNVASFCYSDHSNGQS